MLQSENSSLKPEILKKLREVKFFEMYSKDNAVMSSIASLCSRQKFKKGAAIIKEGEYGDELFIFLSGQIEIVKQTLQNEPYTIVTLDSDTGGVYVGEFALIDNDRRSATAIAKTDCECLVIKRETFIRFGDKNPEIGLNITRAIARQISAMLRKTNTDVITLFSALVEEIAGGG
ncbi:MAG: cyclic nucleotide-binding domain-containing protein [Spirochaetes bacterium]|nr:cyclic nucleotide-binding domain-containing protein [Spirochaetota bacterium]